MLIIAIKPYTQGIKPEQVVHDVETEFSLLNLEVNNVTKRIVKDIEQGELLDDASFIDRMGFKLPILDLSTGCKALLLLQRIKNKFINFSEVGYNARDYALKHFKAGRVILNTMNISADFGRECNIDIGIYGERYRFIYGSDLNYFISNDMGLSGNLSMEYKSIIDLGKIIR